MQWEDGVGGERGGGEEGDAVNWVPAVGAHQPWESDAAGASSAGVYFG